MRIQIILFSVIHFFTTPVLVSQTTDEIRSINATVANIRRNLNDYQRLVQINTDTTNRSVYSDGKELKLISVRCVENHTEKKVSWYFEKGQLIYSEQQWMKEDNSEIICALRGPDHWDHRQALYEEKDSPGQLNTAPVLPAAPKQRYFTEETDHERFYLRGGRLIAWIKNHKAVADSGAEFKAMDERLSAYGKKLEKSF